MQNTLVRGENYLQTIKRVEEIFDRWKEMKVYTHSVLLRKKQHEVLSGLL